MLSRSAMEVPKSFQGRRRNYIIAFPALTVKKDYVEKNPHHHFRRGARFLDRGCVDGCGSGQGVRAAKTEPPDRTKFKWEFHPNAND
jgi:hypothetical protein